MTWISPRSGHRLFHNACDPFIISAGLGQNPECSGRTLGQVTGMSSAILLKNSFAARFGGF